MVNITTDKKIKLIELDVHGVDTNGYHYMYKLSEALDDDRKAAALVEFAGDGYIDYLDGSKVVNYARLSLISLCISKKIDPMDVFDGKLDYHVYMEMCMSMAFRAVTSEEMVMNNIYKSMQHAMRIEAIKAVFMKYIDPKLEDDKQKHKKELFNMLNPKLNKK